LAVLEKGQGEAVQERRGGSALSEERRKGHLPLSVGCLAASRLK
jgi:hypothetical protein